LSISRIDQRISLIEDLGHIDDQSTMTTDCNLSWTPTLSASWRNDRARYLDAPALGSSAGIDSCRSPGAEVRQGRLCRRATRGQPLTLPSTGAQSRIDARSSPGRDCARART